MASSLLWLTISLLCIGLLCIQGGESYEWSEWGPCSATCGGGTRSRTAQCPTCPLGSLKSVQVIKACGLKPCPELMWSKGIKVSPVAAERSASSRTRRSTRHMRSRVPSLLLPRAREKVARVHGSMAIVRNNVARARDRLATAQTPVELTPKQEIVRGSMAIVRGNVARAHDRLAAAQTPVELTPKQQIVRGSMAIVRDNVARARDRLATAQTPVEQTPKQEIVRGSMAIVRDKVARAFDRLVRAHRPVKQTPKQETPGPKKIPKLIPVVVAPLSQETTTLSPKVEILKQAILGIIDSKRNIESAGKKGTLDVVVSEASTKPPGRKALILPLHGIKKYAIKDGKLDTKKKVVTRPGRKSPKEAPKVAADTAQDIVSKTNKKASYKTVIEVNFSKHPIKGTKGRSTRKKSPKGKGSQSAANTPLDVVKRENGAKSRNRRAVASLLLTAQHHVVKHLRYKVDGADQVPNRRRERRAAKPTQKPAPAQKKGTTGSSVTKAAGAIPGTPVSNAPSSTMEANIDIQDNSTATGIWGEWGAWSRCVKSCKDRHRIRECRAKHSATTTVPLTSTPLPTTPPATTPGKTTTSKPIATTTSVPTTSLPPTAPPKYTCVGKAKQTSRCSGIGECAKKGSSGKPAPHMMAIGAVAGIAVLVLIVVVVLGVLKKKTTGDQNPTGETTNLLASESKTPIASHHSVRFEGDGTGGTDNVNGGVGATSNAQPMGSQQNVGSFHAASLPRGSYEQVQAVHSRASVPPETVRRPSGELPGSDYRGSLPRITPSPPPPPPPPSAPHFGLE